MLEAASLYLVHMTAIKLKPRHLRLGVWGVLDMYYLDVICLFERKNLIIIAAT